MMLSNITFFVIFAVFDPWLLTYWLTVSGGRRRITVPDFVKISHFVVEIV